MHAAHGKDMQQPRIGVEQLPRQEFQPAGQRFAAALCKHGVGLFSSKARDFAPVTALDEQRDGVLVMSGTAQQCRSALQFGGAHCRRERVDRPIAQELPQQWMQLIDAGVVRDGLAHEVFVVRKIEQQAARVFLARQRLGDRNRHSRQARDPEQELLSRSLEAVENFAREVIEHQLRRGIARKLGDAAGDFRVLEHEHQSRRPALRALLKCGHCLRRQRQAAQAGDLREFVRPDTQVVPADTCHFAAHLHACQRRERLAAAGDDHAAVLGNLRQARPQHFLQRGICRRLVQIVEHQHRVRPRARKQLAKKPAREGGYVLQVLRSKRGKIGRLSVAELARGVAKIMKEGGHVGIVGIELVPGTLVAARINVTCRQRTLAGARRPRNPGEGSSGLPIQAHEKRLAPHHAAKRGPCRLGEGNRLRTHAGNVSTRTRGGRHMIRRPRPMQDDIRII